jgi:biotin synthase
MKEILTKKIDRLQTSLPSLKELTYLIEELKNSDDETLRYLFTSARLITEKTYGKKVFIRGLIEFSNYCKNNCYYCGIRKDNKSVDRYRLSKEEILECCDQGYQLGFRTFVLQSGEDDFYSAEDIAKLTSSIKSAHPDCAVTLSLGEKSRSEYELFRSAGADRYLLRHESADCSHYKKLKPPALTFENRIRCLQDLKELGFQTGAGFMVGSPFQTSESLAKDLLFLKEFQPHMVGIGPFIPHHATPFKDFPQGSVKLTLIMIALTRILLPHALIPATTALGTADPLGREKGLQAGANVVMPNLSPVSVRKKYELYENKICTSSEAAECIECLKRRLHTIDRQIVVDRGDWQA